MNNIFIFGHLGLLLINSYLLRQNKDDIILKHYVLILILFPCHATRFHYSISKHHMLILIINNCENVPLEAKFQNTIC